MKEGKLIKSFNLFNISILQIIFDGLCSRYLFFRGMNIFKTETTDGDDFD